jgi:hypothetical protein
MLVTMIRIMLRLKTFRFGSMLAALGCITWLALFSSTAVIGSCGPVGLSGFLAMIGMPLLPVGFLLLIVASILAFMKKENAPASGGGFTG